MPYTITKQGSTVPPILPDLQAVRTYEARRDALASVENKAGTTTRSKYAYTVNGIGQRTGLTTTFTLGGGLSGNHGATAWTYDSLGQLKSANAPGTIGSADADRFFEYDDIGNREYFRENAFIDSGGTRTQYFGAAAPSTVNGANALNQYVRIRRGTGATREPVYDFDGNATSYPLPAHNSLSTLAWDDENRLTSVTVNGVTTSYRYDALSRRIAKIAGSVTTLFRYDGWNCIAEYTGSATLSEIRTWGLDVSGSGQGAGGVGGLLAEKTGGTYYYPTFDGNGNVSEYLNANGDTIAHFEYDPFGNTVVNAGSVGLFNYRFSTKPLDFETGLFYYGYRYYDPVTGRWPSRDPIGEEGGANIYGFVGNSALNFVDILGLSGENNPPSYLDGVTDEDEARRIAKECAKTEQEAENAVQRWKKEQGLRKSSMTSKGGKATENSKTEATNKAETAPDEEASRRSRALDEARQYSNDRHRNPGTTGQSPPRIKVPRIRGRIAGVVPIPMPGESIYDILPTTPNYDESIQGEWDFIRKRQKEGKSFWEALKELWNSYDDEWYKRKMLEERQGRGGLIIAIGGDPWGLPLIAPGAPGGGTLIAPGAARGGELVAPAP